MAQLLDGESGGQEHRLAPQAEEQGDDQNAQRQSVVSNAADVLRHSAEDVRHALKRHAPDLKVFGAQPSHGMMGSGSRVETRTSGRRVPRTLQRGELFQKIHSVMFMLLATVASTLDAGMTWVRGVLTQLWNRVPYTSEREKKQPEDMHPPALPQDRNLAPAGSDAAVPAVVHPHVE